MMLPANDGESWNQFLGIPESSMDKADWIAVDWGTTNLRIWGMSTLGDVRAEAKSDKGMNRISQDEYEDALIELANPMLDPERVTKVVVCGMAGAATGWLEAPYQSTPCEPLSVSGTVAPPVRDPRIAVEIIPGISQHHPNYDVMRGEETQIAGFLSLFPDFSGFLCLPGTHTKWVEIRRGTIYRFKSAMTGELLDLLAKHSTLRHVVCHPKRFEWQFDSALKNAVLDAGQLASILFEIRAASLLGGLSPAAATQRFYGTLIGSELASTRHFWENRNLIIIGSKVNCDTYAHALRLFKQRPKVMESARFALKGLSMAHGMIWGRL